MEYIGFPVATVAIFLISTVFLFTIDVLVHKRGEAVSLTSALLWSMVYITSAGMFASYLFYAHGGSAASLFVTGYALEKVLAFDNLFVFSLIFTYFKISSSDRHSALHWGIAGAIVFRLIFVALGVGSMVLIGPLMELVFAALIAYTIYLILTSNDDGADYNNAWYVVRIKRLFPKASVFVIAVCVIEVSDILFAFDSVPAIIAVTKDPLLIYSSMIYAILGLRSMYFVIDALKNYLIYLNATIVVVLSFISGKLAIHAIAGVQISPQNSLIIILSILAVGIALSLCKGVNYEKS